MNSSTHAQGTPVLRQHLPAFRLYLKSEGYSAETIRVYLICLRVLDREAAREDIDLNQLLDQHLEGIPLIVKGKPALTNGFATLIAYLARKKLLVPRGFDAQLNHLLSRYRHFELHDAGLSSNTADMHARIARRFLTFCFKDGDITYSFSRLSTIFTSFLIAFFFREFGNPGVFTFIALSMVVAAGAIGIFGPPTTGRALEEINSE